MSIDVYYDRLTSWTALARFFGYGGGRRQLTVHRALADPAAHGRPTATRLHDLIVESLPPIGAAPRVLDAGCGFGGTMIDLAGRIGGAYVGITVSRAQASAATHAIARAGLPDRVRVEVRSYDDPPAGPFDLVLAIESLAHSRNPAATISALTRELAAQGVFAVVDDMPRTLLPDDADLAAFKSGWRCPVLWSREEYRRALASGGFAVAVDRDLSGDYRPRTLARVRLLERFNRAARAILPVAGWREVMDSYHGGLALERLYRRGVMEYRLLMATRN